MNKSIKYDKIVKISEADYLDVDEKFDRIQDVINE